MNEAPSVGLWSLLPLSLRTAGIIALVTSLVAGVALYFDKVSAEGTPEFSRGGRFAEGGGALDDLSIPTPGARSGVTVRPRSAAVLTAPKGPDEEAPTNVAGARSGFPAFGAYVYSVDGTEEATAFGSRRYPPEMTMTVNRTQTTTDDALDDDELVFDLYFSDDHEEREIVAYRKDGIAFTYEAGEITFGPGFTQTSEASYEPPMLQVPAVLKPGRVVEGTSTATSPDGRELRVEDWTVTVEGADTLEIMGERLQTRIVRIERQSRPGSSEQVTRTRRYWFAPSEKIWVKWEETMEGSQDVGPGAFRYETEFTATLDRIEPL